MQADRCVDRGSATWKELSPRSDRLLRVHRGLRGTERRCEAVSTKRMRTLSRRPPVLRPRTAPDGRPLRPGVPAAASTLIPFSGGTYRATVVGRLSEGSSPERLRQPSRGFPFGNEPSSLSCCRRRASLGQQQSVPVCYRPDREPLGANRITLSGRAQPGGRAHASPAICRESEQARILSVYRYSVASGPHADAAGSAD